MAWYSPIASKQKDKIKEITGGNFQFQCWTKTTSLSRQSFAEKIKDFIT